MEYFVFAGWIVLFMTIMIFFSISVAGTFRWKTGPWIGIVTFIVLINLLSWLENVIFSGKFSPNDLFQFTEESTGISFSANGVIWADGRWGTTVFEMALAALLVWGIIYMNTKKWKSDPCFSKRIQNGYNGWQSCSFFLLAEMNGYMHPIPV